MAAGSSFSWFLTISLPGLRNKTSSLAFDHTTTTAATTTTSTTTTTTAAATTAATTTTTTATTQQQQQQQHQQQTTNNKQQQQRQTINNNNSSNNCELNAYVRTHVMCNDGIVNICNCSYDHSIDVLGNIFEPNDDMMFHIISIWHLSNMHILLLITSAHVHSHLYLLIGSVPVYWGLNYLEPMCWWPLAQASLHWLDHAIRKRLLFSLLLNQHGAWS